MGTQWFAVHSVTRNGFRCPACGVTFDLGHRSADHHPAICPGCGVTSLHWTASAGPNITIVPSLAPDPLRLAIDWAQHNLDELEAAELWVALAELAAAVAIPPAGSR